MSSHLPSRPRIPAAAPATAGARSQTSALQASALQASALQRRAAERRPGQHLAPAGRGRALPAAVREKMERALGHDFSRVRIHEGTRAESLGAIAYTRGTDLHFAPGRYSPATRGGQELIGHELAHVVQQQAGRVATPGGAGAPINADPGLEAEAERLGAAAARSTVPAAAGPAAEGGGGGSAAPVQRSESAERPHRPGQTLARLPESAARATAAAPIQRVKRINKYTLPKAYTTGLDKRPDSGLINTHFQAIGDHYEYHRKAASRADRLIRKHSLTKNLKLERSWRSKARAARAKMTEAIGEMNATNYILRRRKYWRMLRGFAAGTGFDQVWKTPKSGKIAIVEAKGPGAKLGISDRKGGQMSLSWVRQTAKSLKGNDFGIGTGLSTGKPKVRGYVITSTPTGKAAQKNWDKIPYN